MTTVGEVETVITLRSSERRHVAVASHRVPLLHALAVVSTDRLVTARRRLCVTFTPAHVHST